MVRKEQQTGTTEASSRYLEQLKLQDRFIVPVDRIRFKESLDFTFDEKPIDEGGVCLPTSAYGIILDMENQTAYAFIAHCMHTKRQEEVNESFIIDRKETKPKYSIEIAHGVNGYTLYNVFNLTDFMNTSFYDRKFLADDARFALGSLGLSTEVIDAAVNNGEIDKLLKNSLNGSANSLVKNPDKMAQINEAIIPACLEAQEKWKEEKHRKIQEKRQQAEN